MCKAIRQRLRMKVYLCYIAKYSLIPYINTKYEKDYRIIPLPVSSCCAFYFLRAFKEGLPYYESKVFQVLVFSNKGPHLLLVCKR